MDQKPTIPAFIQVLIIMILPWIASVNTIDNLCQLSQNCRKQVLRCREYLDSKGILTFLPFLVLPVRQTVRTNLPLTELHCQGTLALSAAEILTPL